MQYDCLIIGGGLAGLTCGIRCSSSGLRTAIISGGMNSLHFSSGSIDIAGYAKNGDIIKDPFDHLTRLIKEDMHHPYRKTGIKTIRKSIDFFTSEVEQEGLALKGNGGQNHFHLTNFGTMKPTYLSQESVFNEDIPDLLKSDKKIAILNFSGFRDYYPEQTLANLKDNPLFKDREIILGEISLPYYSGTNRNLHEFRSVDIARYFETEKYLPRIADEIIKASGDACAVSLPAFLGIRNFSHIRKKLEELTGRHIYEIPTLPPSILGLRIDNALKSSFMKYGGEYSSGDRVLSGTVKDHILQSVRTVNSGEMEITAKYFVLATGSFFSGGLTSEFDKIYEPVFNLKLNAENKRDRWYNNKFFGQRSHPFLSYGVETDKRLNPLSSAGKTMKNIFCAGSILSGYDPVKEGSGGGVAVSTGYCCAEKIIKELSK